ncbi:MAG: hypothetical protein JRJ12_16700, partial [Deltaproteobacteria bacterium]|nr:hypothetical protein [Deltaproteobacteria bacterium]
DARLCSLRSRPSCQAPPPGELGYGYGYDARLVRGLEAVCFVTKPGAYCLLVDVKMKVHPFHQPIAGG